MLQYQLWITHENGKFEKFCFNTAKEAYLYYLDNFATPEEDEYYFSCCGQHLVEIADNNRLIGCVFRNVFNEQHRLYFVSRNYDGTISKEDLELV